MENLSGELVPSAKCQSGNQKIPRLELTYDTKEAVNADETFSKSATTEEAQLQSPLKPVQLVLLYLALALAVFLVALDEGIIAVAIPRISDTFNSLDDVGWYGSAYLLTQSCFQLHYGKLYKHLSSKWVLLSSVTLFEIGSLVCATSPNSPTLIAGRAVAGTGAAGIISGVLIIISQVVPLRKRSMYVASVGSIYGVTGICSPLMGGALTDSYLTWRWCFYINLPAGALVVVAILFLFTPEKVAAEDCISLKDLIHELDPIGLILFVGSMVCLILALQYSQEHGWNSNVVIALMVSFASLIILFAALQTRLQERGTVPPRLALKRQVPIWFQAVKRTSAEGSGIRSLPYIIGAVSASLLSGFVISKTGHFSPVIILGSVIASVGCGTMNSMNPSSGPSSWISFQALVGIGVGLGMQQGAVIVQNGLEKGDIPTAITIVIFFQILGAAILVSLTQSVFSARAFLELKHYLPSLTRQIIFHSGATDLINLAPEGERDMFISVISKALTQSWYVPTAAASISAFCALALGFRKLDK